MVNTRHGASLTLALPDAGLTPELVERVCRSIIQPERMKSMELWSNPIWIKRAIEVLVQRKEYRRIDVYWEPPKDGPVDMSMMLSYCIDPTNPDSLLVDDLTLLRVFVYDIQLEAHNAEKYPIVVEKFKDIISIAQPEFAVIDHYHKSVRKRKSEDLRRYAWGVTVYGPQLVDAIGPDKLKSVPAWRLEEMPWGGMWVQAARNPFEAVPAAVKAVEKHLGLKQLFGEAPAAKKVKAKAAT